MTVVDDVVRPTDDESADARRPRAPRDGWALWPWPQPIVVAPSRIVTPGSRRRLASMAYTRRPGRHRRHALIGSYSVKGWAHPGPLTFWLASPLFRLTGGDARALEWTAAAINMATVVALAAVAWRRGRWPLLVGVMALTTVLIHAIGPDLLIDLWNPHVPLLPFLLTVLLVWDAALGRRRALVEAPCPPVVMQ